MPRSISRRGPVGFAVQAENLDARGRIGGVGETLAVFHAGEPVLRREERDQLHARRFHQVDIALAVAVEPGVIGDQTRRVCPASGAKCLAARTSRPVWTCALRPISRRRPGPAMVSLYPVRRTPGAVIPSAAAAIVATLPRSAVIAGRRNGMDAVGEQDDVGVRDRVDPDAMCR